MKIQTSNQNLKNYKIYLKVEQAVEQFLQKKGYLELDLPVLSPALIPESYLEIFKTEFNYFNKKDKLYLIPSPELFMKRLLVRGIGDCYYLGKSFRNSEPNSSFHSREFTMLEYYRVGATYLQLADEILEMMEFIAKKVASSHSRESGNLYNPGFLIKSGMTRKLKQVRHDKKGLITYQDKKISFEKWEKFTVAQAFEKFAQITEVELFDDVLFIKRAKEKGYKIRGFSYQDVFSQIISQEIEPKLGKNGYPSLLYDYPKQMASLAKLNKDKKTARRVEFYINGIEIGGCCEELNNWKEQEKRFKMEEFRRKKEKKIRHRIDKGFIEALQYGLPDCTGAGIGFERLAMIFANVTSIGELKLVNVI